MKNKDIILNGDNDQPTTCPKCGTRTELVHDKINVQDHKCNGCGYEFVLEFNHSQL